MLNGITGVNLASFLTATQGVNIDLAVTSAQFGNAGSDEVGDILLSIEGLEGSNLSHTLSGDNVSNSIPGKDGNDVIDGRGGFDLINGGNGSDTILGGLGSDDITGKAGADSINGEDGLDTLSGDSEGDTISGGARDEVITGGAGAELMTGGTGFDIFVFTSGFRVDQISDFGPDDIINLASQDVFENFQDIITYQASQLGNDALIADGLGDSILLKNVVLESLTEGDFMF